MSYWDISTTYKDNSYSFFWHFSIHFHLSRKKHKDDFLASNLKKLVYDLDVMILHYA